MDAEIADAREEVEESKKHLDEINEQIADRERRYAVYEKKIDKVLAAGKPVPVCSVNPRENCLPEQ